MEIAPIFYTMDRIQPFIEDCLLTKCFDNPRKPIDEGRLVPTLFMMPTDGGQRARLRRKKNINLFNQNSDVKKSSTKQKNYKSINKNSKLVLKEYINKCKTAVASAKKIAVKEAVHERTRLQQILAEEYTDIWTNLPKYSNFLPMSEELWSSYIRELLSIPNNHKIGSPLRLNGQQTLMKLSMADYNGCRIKVVKSKNKCLLNLEGIVLWDAQKSFIIVSEGKLVDEIKSIPKKGSTFEFQIPLNAEESLAYTIIGDRFKYRSSDRAGRKFKSRRCDDMLYYIAT